MDKLDIEAMLDHSKVVTGVLRVVYALRKIDDFTKEDAAEELINFLAEEGFFESVEHYEGSK